MSKEIVCHSSMLVEITHASGRIFLDDHNCKEVCTELFSLKPTGNESSVQIPVTEDSQNHKKNT